MFKYDDVISSLTLVNTLARDVDYGNPRRIKEQCRLKVNIGTSCEFENRQFSSRGFCELSSVKNFCRTIFLKFLQFKMLADKIKIAILDYFIFSVNLYKSLILCLQKIVLYAKLAKQEYG